MGTTPRWRAPRIWPGASADLLEEILHLTQDCARMFLKDDTGRGEQDAFAAPLKQRHAQPRLKIAHLLRDIWLRNP